MCDPDFLKVTYKCIIEDTFVSDYLFRIWILSLQIICLSLSWKKNIDEEEVKEEDLSQVKILLNMTL